ncbi:MAG: 3-phosphoshikimate 1-carboxyvinyltransferase [Candidatus Omnitrophica bacterium]|nr:3-phosphoshikimate 1-carboxyvinyltransferase [Candidatus Omnitrophota bacterium]MCM8797987.1 3-phosphoshikimate 1-carboxyvinyltransferase [Candidatus Omnitrophota bacterium]
MFRVSPIEHLEGEISFPGDKSISHRMVILSSLAEGDSYAENFLISDDSLRTIEAFRKMGIEIREERNRLRITGRGLNGLKPPSEPLYMGGSGTSARLILGVLAGQKFRAVLSGDASLSRRPMRRVTLPLREMGAKIEGPADADFLPLTIEGSDLKPIEYKMPVASAQVKSAILLAGLYAWGETKVIEPMISRDHTERLLKLFGGEVKKDGLTNTISGRQRLKGIELCIPGDISSAANFIVLALLVKKSRLLIQRVGLNPTRTGILNVLKRMGARIEVVIKGGEDTEPYGDIEVRNSSLKGTLIEREEIPRLIDELPLLMVCGCFADGVTWIEGGGELRVKETDRINSMVTNLRRLGAEIEVEGDKVVIKGGSLLRGNRVSSFSDHRTAMSMLVIGSLIPGETILDEVNCINKSFPEFFSILTKIANR